VQTSRNVRRLAGALALVTAGGGLVAACTPAGPTATLDTVNSVLNVVGTPNRDVVAARVTADQVLVDFGADGTTDVQFSRSQVRLLQVVTGEGDDAVTVTGPGVGDILIQLLGDGGNDSLAVRADPGKVARDNEVRSIFLGGFGGNDDIVLAAPGVTAVFAGEGDDRVTGGNANFGKQDIDLGPGDDRLVTSFGPALGVRNDVVRGGDGRDTMELEGTPATERLNLSPKLDEQFGRPTSVFTMKINQNFLESVEVEVAKWFGFGGPTGPGGGDQVVVGDLTPTDVVQFLPDFSSGRGAATPNRSQDRLVFSGSSTFRVEGQTAFDIRVAGLGIVANAFLLQPEDSLEFDARGGTVDSSGLVPGLVRLIVR
jgi:hypothetical protein